MHTALATYLANTRQDQFRFLKDLVLQSSHTGDKTGVDKVGSLIARELSDTSLTMEVDEQQESGNHLVFRSPACVHHSRSILLVGHMDTVFPPDSSFNWYREEAEYVRGPGVIDMKGGLAVAVYALKALHDHGLLEEIPITFICNSDEETGSPTSRNLIAAEAKRSVFGLVFECGGLAGEMVTGRKGKSGYLLKVTGQAGHAAFAGPDKGSAILEMAGKIIAIEELNDPARHLVVNVGQVGGGSAPNVIAEEAWARIDTRFMFQSDNLRCAKELNRITKNCRVPSTDATLTLTSGREPMEQTDANRLLYRLLHEQAENLGLPLKEELRNGVSDANIIAAAGTPVVDGLGPIGDCDHSDREYMMRSSLPERTLLAAIAIPIAWQRFSVGDLKL